MNKRRTAAKKEATPAPPEPRLRRMAALQINGLKDGCVVYQPEQERVHFLNRTAAAVLELCNGRRGFADIEARVAERFDHHTPDHELTGHILRSFIAEGLVRLEPEPAACSAREPPRPTRV
jgi:hypothetical protein